MKFVTNVEPYLPGNGWKVVWHDRDSGDKVFIHEEKATVKSVFGRRCDRHHHEEFCTRCLSRIEEGMKAARRALDPEASPHIELVEGEDSFPEKLALVNPVAKNAFALRLAQPNRFMAEKMIFTSVKKEGRFEWPIPLVDYCTESQVCDAIYMSRFYVRLGDGLSEEYTKRLWESEFSLSIDGEPMTEPQPFRDILAKKEVLLPRPGDIRGCLFNAHTLLDNGETDENGWVGYMLPNGSRIKAELKGVPEGGGLVKIEIGWDFGNYTSKVPKATKP